METLNDQQMKKSAQFLRFYSHLFCLVLKDLLVFRIYYGPIAQLVRAHA